MKIVRRTLSEYIKDLINRHNYILVSGLRSTGKSICIMQSMKTKSFIDFSNIKELITAYNKQHEFFNGYKSSVTINHVEQAVSLLKYTCSLEEKVVMLACRNISDTEEYKKYLEYKCLRLTLYGLSIYELANAGHIQKPFIPAAYPACIISKKSAGYTFKQIWKGFFPEVCMEEDEGRWNVIMGSIMEDILYKDISGHINPNSRILFVNFLKELMLWIGSELNIKEIAEKLSIAPNTIKSWVSLLESINFIYLLKPYITKGSRRYIKTPKLYVTDTSLASWLLSMNSGEDIEKSTLRDKFFENFAVMEIIKSYRHNGRDNEFYHYRDNLKAKVDLLIEYSGCYYPVNIKAVTTVDESMVLSFKKLCTDKMVEYGALICLTDKYKKINEYSTAVSIWEI